MLGMFGLLLGLLLVEAPEPPNPEPPPSTTPAASATTTPRPAQAVEDAEPAPAPAAAPPREPAGAAGASDGAAGPADEPRADEPPAGDAPARSQTPRPRRRAPRQAAPPPQAPPPLQATPAVGPADADPDLLQVVGSFFAALHRGLPHHVARLCDTPFRLEEETLETGADVRRRWRRALADKPWASLPLFGVEALPWAEMIERHGPPPKRLGPIDGDGAWVGIANVDGTPAVAVFRKTAGGWRAIAYTD